MEMHTWYRKIVDRAMWLNGDAPWIYTETWLHEFLRTLNDAFSIQDLDWIHELENSLDWF